jgi:hypothetical protein
MRRAHMPVSPADWRGRSERYQQKNGVIVAISKGSRDRTTAWDGWPRGAVVAIGAQIPPT